MLILKVVAMGPVHGYAISKRIQQISRDVLCIQQGSLHRLEKRKWLKAAWRAADSGREAKFYELTAAGRKQLATEESDWERLSTAIALIMQQPQS